MKVMHESLAAACHHLGQPAMILTLGIEILRGHSGTNDLAISGTIDQCRAASADLNEVLKKLQNLREYKTEPYLPGADGDEGEFPGQILVVS